MKLLNGRDIPIEVRLTQFFLISEIIWSLVNTVITLLIGLPVAISLVCAGVFAWAILVFALGFATHTEAIAKYIFLASFLIIVPIQWYAFGGTKGSANVLFVCLYVAYIMCLSGKKRYVFLTLAIILTPICQAIDANIERPLWLTITQPRQQALSGNLLGISTSLIIVALLVKQKNEYVRERDAAVASEKSLEQSNRLQKNFLANMSHEIRSPLGIVLGFNKLIMDSDDVEQIHDYSKNIDSAGKTLRTVINDILDYSKIESGKLDIIKGDYIFSDTIDEISTDIKLKAEEKGLSFFVFKDKKIPNNLNGDSVRIRQCLLNVLSNAVKYTDKGEIVFKSELVSRDDDKCIIRFKISDTGRGIGEETLDKLFEPFQRLDEGHNRGIEGTGLGLSITKSLLDEMNGDISVSSKKGEGSTFVITIEQNIAMNVPETSAVKVNKNHFEGINVLVVDDTRMNLTLMSKFLNKMGIVSTAVDNGIDALKECERTKYDIIFLDHMMPNMNGIEVFLKLKEAKGINDDTPVIMLTANAMTGISQEYLDMGFNGYVSKPIEVNKLEAEISKVLDKGEK